MPSEMKVILAQARPRLRDTTANLETIRRILAEHGGADLVVFPELFLSCYTVQRPEELAVDLDGPEVKSVGRAARDASAAVIFGAAERIPRGVANSAIFVDRRGEVVGSYRKTHLFGDERRVFVAGDEFLVVDLDGVRTGLMICFDVEFPEVARSLARARADLLVTISANMDPFGRDHEVFATARALENGLPHLYVNQVGRGEAFTFAGGTMALSADGDVLAALGLSEGIAELTFDPSTRNVDRPEDLRPAYLREARGALPVLEGRAGKSIIRR